MCSSDKFFVLLLLFFLITYPQWSADPATNLAICTVAQTQRETKTCRDNEGNIYIFWRDYRNEPITFGGDIYAQKLNIKGEAQWAANGISIVTKSAAQFDAKVLYDGSDGIYLVWREATNLFSDYKIYAQRISLDGTKLWGNYGILLQIISGKAVSHSISVNVEGDLLVCWQLGLTNTDAVDLYAQKINHNGIIQWVSGGLIICNGTARHVYGSRIISDHKGGAYITWSDNRTDLSNFDIYAQRIISNGNLLWAPNGISVCQKAANQGTKNIISNENVGVIIFWEIVQGAAYSIAAQKVDSLGNTLWETGERILYSVTKPLFSYEFIPDKNKEIFFLWSDSEKNIYAQKIGYDGNIVWNNPKPINTNKSVVTDLAVCPSDVNGIVIAWLDNRDGNNDVYSQWINSEGTVIWNINGVAACNEVHEQADYSVTSDKFGGAAIAWADMRNGNFDIYIQNIDAKGKPGTNRYLFERKNINKTISSSAQARDTISVSLPALREQGHYSFSVLLNSLTHQSVNELTIKLSHSLNTDTIVYNLSGGEYLINTVLNDDALNPVNNGYSPFTGLYKPYKPLSPFVATNLDGEWILIIEDNAEGNNGVLDSWGLVFNKGEITSTEENDSYKFPNEFILNQNYPNPFNPSTKIRFAIPTSPQSPPWQGGEAKLGWLVTLKVYDILGNEIATLVNEEKPAGEYEVEFDSNRHSREGGNLTSGVYFYRLQVGSFVQTKKMVYLK